MNILKKNFLFFLIIVSLNPIVFSQTGPGGVGTNDGNSSLKLWLDANKGVFSDTLKSQQTEENNFLRFWEDLSGSNNHVAAVADSNRPLLTTKNLLLNSQNSIRFFKATDSNNVRSYLVSKSFSKTDNITIYCVFHPLTKSGGNDSTPVKDTKYGPNMWYTGSGLVDAGANSFSNDISLAFCNTSIAAGAGDSTTKTDYCVKIPASINTSYFAKLEKDVLYGKLKISSNSYPTAEFQAGTQPINDAPRYFIGSNTNVYGPSTYPFFDGYIANVLVYNKILTGVEKIILENYLSSKYELPLSFNDIYKFDESKYGNYDFDLVGIGKADDGSQQFIAQGDGIIELSNISGFSKGDFVFVAHDGKTLDTVNNDLPDGFLSRFDRKWISSNTNNVANNELSIDSKYFANQNSKNVFLLIDTDSDNSFSDEKLGEGIIPVSEITNSNKFLFRPKTFKNGNTFTFAIFKEINACTQNCEDNFTPNGDGFEDVIYIKPNGKCSIFDKSGKKIKTIQTPSYWDGTNDSGEALIPGLYFVSYEGNLYTTITLIK